MTVLRAVVAGACLATAMACTSPDRAPSEEEVTTTTYGGLVPRNGLGGDVPPELLPDVTSGPPQGAPAGPPMTSLGQRPPCPPAPAIVIDSFTAEPNPAAKPNQYWVLEVRGRIDNRADDGLRGVDIRLEVVDGKGERTNEPAGIRDDQGRFDPFIATVPATSSVHWGYSTRTYPGFVAADRPEVAVAHLRYAFDENFDCTPVTEVRDRRARQAPG